MINSNYWISNFEVQKKVQKSNYAEKVSTIGIPIVLTSKFVHKPLLFHGRLGDTNSKGVGYKMHEPSKVLGTKCINHFLDLDLGF